MSLMLGPKQRIFSISIVATVVFIGGYLAAIYLSEKLINAVEMSRYDRSASELNSRGDTGRFFVDEYRQCVAQRGIYGDCMKSVVAKAQESKGEEFSKDVGKHLLYYLTAPYTAEELKRRNLFIGLNQALLEPLGSAVANNFVRPIIGCPFMEGFGASSECPKR